MSYKYVTISMQDEWLETQHDLGKEPIDMLLNHLLEEPDWHLLVLKQSLSDCVFLIRSDFINEVCVRETFETIFMKSFQVTQDHFYDIIALKFEDLEQVDALALGAGMDEKKSAMAVQAPSENRVPEFEVALIDFEKIFQEVDLEWLGNYPIDDLDLSNKTYNCLMRGKVHSIAELIAYSREGLSKFRNMSLKSIEEIERKLGLRGLRLAEDGAQPLSSGVVDKDDQSEGPADALIGGREFSELLTEFRKVAPVIKVSGTLEVFSAQSYLFAINDGYGLTTWLTQFSLLLTKLGLHGVNPGSTREYILPLSLDEKNNYSPWKDFLLNLAEDFQKFGNSLIMCLDISEWLPHLKEERFRSYLHQLEPYIGKVIFVFRVPFLEKDALDNVRRVLSDVLTIRSISFPPFTTEELLQFTETMLRQYGLSLSNDAVSVLTARISEEKRDGRFYGIKTMKKICREMIYLKQLSMAEGKNPDRKTIVGGDILSLSASDLNSKSGMEQFNELVGLTDLKHQILEILTLIEVARKQKKQMPTIHMTFTGNPGTGKTTVARILGKILSEKGILRNGSFFEYSGRDFCGRYVGETAPKTAAMCRDAYGSVLFIDEAYSLYSGDNDKDYGKEALTTLIAEMENHRDDLLVIMAGYSDEMDNLMKGNLGLQSRMPYSLTFPNYDRDELASLFMSMAQKEFSCDKDLRAEVVKYFEALPEDTLNDKAFSNARFVRNLFERTWCKASLRHDLADTGEMITLRAEDFRQAASGSEFAKMLEKKRRSIGFGV